MKKILIMTLLVGVILAFCCSCSTPMLPAEDIEVFNVCKEEIAILKNPNIPANSEEKYRAALSLSSKVDFSYVRTVAFLNKVFDNKDANMNRIDKDLYAIRVFYQYKTNYISFEFMRYENNIISATIKRK